MKRASESLVLNQTVKQSRIYTAILINAVVVAGLLFWFGRFFPISGDLVPHFLLVDEIMKYGGVRPPPVVNLGTMAFYPPGSHWMAALVGWVGGSGLVGIVVISVASVYLAYLMIIKLVDANVPANILLFALIFLALSKTHSQIGWEVSVNFFYPQLVANVIFFGSLVWLAGNVGVWRQAIFIAVSGAIAMFVQPLVAVHVLGAGTMLITYQGVDQWIKTSRFPTKIALALVFVFAAAIALVLFHPSFKVMRQIAANDGVLDFNYSDPLLVTIVCSVIGAVNLWRHFSGRAQYVDAVLGSAVLAAVFLMALQFIVLHMDGSGSVYAVKKHMFIAVTLGAINVTRLLSSLLAISGTRWPIGWVVSPVVAGLMSILILQKFDTPIVPALRAISYAKQAVNYGLAGFVPGNTVDADSTKSPLVNLMVSIGVFEYPYPRTWFGNDSPTVRGAKFAMVRRTPEIDANCDERFVESYDYVIVPPVCLEIYTPGRTLAFGTDGDGSFFIGKGWGMAESWGMWSIGDQSAEISLSLPPGTKGPYELEVNANAFVHATHPHQTVLVDINGVQVATWTFNIASSGGKRIAIIPAHAVTGSILKITFKTPAATSPVQINPHSTDKRVLGLGLMTLTVRRSSNTLDARSF